MRRRRANAGVVLYTRSDVAFERLLHAIGQARAVGKTGQRIVERLMAKLIIQFAELTNAGQRTLRVLLGDEAEHQRWQREHACPEHTKMRVAQRQE